MRKVGIVIALACSISSAASGKSSRDFYFNKPKATVADLDADTQRCVAQSHGQSINRSVTGVGHSPASAAANAAIAGLAVGLVDSLIQGGKQRHFVEECLRIAGWRQVLLSAAQAAELKHSLRQNRAVALASIVGADPITIVSLGPSWQNSYAQPRLVEGKAK